MLDVLKRQWVRHVKDNPITYLLIVFIFITGIMAGAFTVISLSSQQKIKVSNFLQEFFNSQQSFSINRWAILKESLWQHLITSLFIWFFGLFIWGIPFILLIVGIRGFSFGFTIGFMVEHYKFGGFLFSLICILPQSIIYVPCYIGMGIVAIHFSLNRIQRPKQTGQYSTRIVIIFLILMLGVSIETFISPFLFPLFIWIFR
ncbi:MAG: stage II sporulation protein M [Clostridiales bacterium]|nr:stage II sporulation protein M [Clostridiales bacterium]